jgi:hypothetical protein
MQRIWIEVEIPVPKTIEVRGRVRPEKPRKGAKKGQSLSVVR